MNKKQVYEELEKVGMEVNNMINFDLIKGAIYGGAVGDALGVPVECRTRTDVRNTSFKKIEKELSFFSDDTSLTLASMDALVKSDFKRETRQLCSYITIKVITYHESIFRFYNET